MSSADRLASAILSGGTPTDGHTVLLGGRSADLISGTVVAVGPPIRVDSGNQRLACDTIIGVAVNEVVWVLQDGTENLIVGVAGRAAAPYSGVTHIVADDATNSGVHDTSVVLTSPFTGWIEVVVSGDCGFSSATISGLAHLLYTNTVTMTSGGVWATTSTPVQSVGVGAWAHHLTIVGVYPVAAGARCDPVHRQIWTPNAGHCWIDVWLSWKIYES